MSNSLFAFVLRWFNNCHIIFPHDTEPVDRQGCKLKIFTKGVLRNVRTFSKIYGKE